MVTFNIICSYFCMNFALWILYCIPAVEWTFSVRPRNEKVRKTIAAEVAMTAPSPENFTVMDVGCGPSIVDSCVHNDYVLHAYVFA